MSTATFEAATDAAVLDIAARLRAADLVEIGVTSPGQSPADVLLSCIRTSRWATVCRVDGIPAFAYGVADGAEPNVGSPWMLGTDDVHRVARFFLLQSRHEMHLMLTRYPVLANVVHRDNALSIKWLEWLGFKIDRDRPVGPGGALYVFWKGAARRV